MTFEIKDIKLRDIDPINKQLRKKQCEFLISLIKQELEIEINCKYLNQEVNEECVKYKRGGRGKFG